MAKAKQIVGSRRSYSRSKDLRCIYKDGHPYTQSQNTFPEAALSCLRKALRTDRETTALCFSRLAFSNAEIERHIWADVEPSICTPGVTESMQSVRSTQALEYVVVVETIQSFPVTRASEQFVVVKNVQRFSTTKAPEKVLVVGTVQSFLKNQDPEQAVNLSSPNSTEDVEKFTKRATRTKNLCIGSMRKDMNFGSKD